MDSGDIQMNGPISLDKAIALTVKAFEGKKDKGGNSYIRHCLRVMHRVEELSGSEDEMIVAILHDVAEDTRYTLEDLKDLGCTEAQLKAIDALTKREGESYRERIKRVKQSTVATKVKIADIKDNMELWRIKGAPELDDKSKNRLAEYIWAYHELGGGIS
jgi:(p)ppGpp synthase/HD superfamily hydrolase